MALTDEGGGGIPATMLVGPASVGGGSMPYPYPVFGGMGGGQGGFGNEGGWWIVLLIIVIAALGGNWGGNGGGGFGQPVVINDGGGSVQRGFDQAAIMAGLTAIQSGICSGFGDVTQQLYTNQIADMQQSFALQSAFSDCCCKNQLATESLRATVLSENCADRYEAAQNTRDIIDNANRNNQAILDKLCALELDGYKREVDSLRSQLTAANLAASQTAQTARILADNAAQTVALEQYLNPTPIPAYVVQNPNCCPQNTGCGCGGF